MNGRTYALDVAILVVCSFLSARVASGANKSLISILSAPTIKDASLEMGNGRNCLYGLSTI